MAKLIDNFGKGLRTNGFDKNPQNICKTGQPRKIYNVLRKKGFHPDDIKETFGEMAFYTLKELQAVYKDNTKPVIMRITANQFYLAMKHGSWSRIKEIMEYIIHKPKTALDVTSDGEPMKQVFILGGKEIEV